MENITDEVDLHDNEWENDKVTLVISNLKRSAG